MEHKFLTLIAPALLVVAASTSFLMAGRAPLSLNQHLSWLRDSSAIAAGGLWLALGLRHVRRIGIGRKSAPFPFAGLFILGLLGLSSFSALRFAESAAEFLDEPNLERVKENAAAVISNPDSTSEERARASTFRARLAFTRAGELLPVLNESGVEAPYRPTEQDHENRRTEQELRLLLPHAMANARVSLHGLSVVSVIALASGLLTPVRRVSAV